ncbi:Hypothetical predicted protein [Mytilus galloprovincialis]|uniref:Reverse transcriptase domain-containing protein n=1 Tax=Mytilus galloprovincialis TaxID=29158 RepID=A0A8B6GQM9_MYTGA|nr:Hypothetical predicted protein [Mytilus galloprovincialis]
MPCSGSKNADDEFKAVLEEIGEIIYKFKPTCGIIMTGDVNASIMKENMNRRDKLFLDFIHEFELHIPESSSSRIDYILLSNHNIINQFVNLERDYINTSQHDPVMALGKVGITAKQIEEKNHINSKKINWEKVNRTKYQLLLYEKLQLIDIDNLDINITCSNVNIFTEMLCNIIDTSAKECAKPNKQKSRPRKRYWPDEIKKACCENKHHFWKWKMAGRPRDQENIHFRNMKNGKRKLRSTQRQLEAVARKQKFENIMTDLLKRGIATPENKRKGKPLDDPNSYRKITVTSILNKILEKLYLEKKDETFKNAQSPLQRGFTKGILIAEAQDLHRPLYVAFLDAQKAFDLVWHSSLLRKLHQSGIESDSWLMFKEWYKDLTSQIKWESELSKVFSEHQGVRQGGVTSPAAYKLFINPMLDHIETQNLGSYIGPIYCGTPTVADDVCLVSNNPEDLQAMLDIQGDYANKEHYCINKTKSSVVQFNDKQPRNFTMNSEEIPTSQSIVHLGIERDNSSKFGTKNISNTRISAARKATYALMGAGLHDDGNYIYLNASNIEPGQISNFTSVTVSSEDYACFTFWFHMYGNVNGTLNVYLVSENMTQKLWSRSGNGPDLWQLAFVDILMIDTYKITLEGVRGSTNMSGIAVDDIALLPGSCNKRGNTAKMHWSQSKNNNRWTFANFTISRSEPYRIIFEGVSGNGYWSHLAFDDISLLQRSCSGSIQSSQKCHNMDESISLHECSKHYLQFNDTSLVFDPEFDNCSAVYQDVQTSIRSFCNDINNSDICTFDLPEPKMEDQRCFYSNWLSVEYKCEAEVPSTSKGSSEVEETTTVALDATSRDDSSAGLIVGLVIGSFVLVFIVAVICSIRRFLMEKSNLEKIENLQGNDYTGHQSIALQQSSIPPHYEVVQNTNNQYAFKNIAMTNSNECINNVENDDEHKHIAPLEDDTKRKHELKVNQYDVFDSTVITSFCQSTEDKPRETENLVLDQKETELDRSKMSDKTQSYDVTTTINAVGPHACAGFHSRDGVTIVTKLEDKNKHISPLEDEFKEKIETKGNPYEEIDPTAITSVCHSTEDKPSVIKNYTVLEPKETGLDKSKMTNNKQSYQLAKPIRTGNDQCVMSKVEPPACAGFHSKDDVTLETENDDESKHIAPLEDKTKGKFETKGNQYEEIDPTAITSVWHSKEDKPSVINNYTVLDPKETGFYRSEMTDNKQSYELAKPDRAEKDHYGMLKEGTYDCAGRNNHKEFENIYNHAIDNVYDSGSHERKDFGNEDAYDHL